MERSVRMLRMGLLSWFASVSLVAPTLGAPVTDPMTSHSYEVIKEGKTWDDARSAAAAMSAPGLLCHLATITSAAENDFVVDQVLTPLGAGGEDDPDVWIGGERRDACPMTTDDASLWGNWVTGEDWSYTNWRPGEPDNCDESCLLYGRDEEPPMWENEFCTEGPAGGDEEVWYLVECEPLKIIDPVNRHSYELIQEGKTWFDARARAAAMSTRTQSCHLATITSAAENDFVTTGLLNGAARDVWIGGERRDPCPDDMDSAALWGKWVTGEPWVYTNWAPGAPDECEDSCLLYTNNEEETEPMAALWDEEDCANGTGGGSDDIWCLVECEPVTNPAPAVSASALIILALLLAASGWWALTRRRSRSTGSIR